MLFYFNFRNSVPDLTLSLKKFLNQNRNLNLRRKRLKRSQSQRESQLHLNLHSKLLNYLLLRPLSPTSSTASFSRASTLPQIKKKKKTETVKQLDVDALIRLRDKEGTSIGKMSQAQLLSSLGLKSFDKNEEMDKFNIEREAKRERKEREMKVFDKEGNEIIVSPIQKWKAISWAIVHFLWLYKITQQFRSMKKDNEEKPLSATMQIVSQAIRVWLFDILKTPVTSVDTLNTNILDAKFVKSHPNKDLELSFRKI